MARRKSQKRSLQRDLVTAISFILILLVVLGAEAIGIDVLPQDSENNSADNETTDDAPVVENAPVEENAPPISSQNTAPTTTEKGTVFVSPDGGWYTLVFTRPINTNNRSLQVGSPVEQQLVAAIDSAQRSIDAALFELDLQSVTDALLRAHRERNVRIRMVMDDDHGIDDEDATVDQLVRAGIPVRSDERGALMHHKFLIIDGSQVWMGSLNFKYSETYNNNNNALLVRSSRLAQNYQGEFNEMFENGVFTRRGDVISPTRQITIRTTSGQSVLIETYFSPEDGNIIVGRLVELIGSAQSSVRIMAFSFTLPEIANAMIERFNQGVDVIGLFETTGSLQGQMIPLLCAGVPVKQDGNPNILHHKVIVIDGKIVATGSFNFSGSARDDNSENMLVIHSPELAEQYLQEFDRLYNDPRARTVSRAERCS